MLTQRIWIITVTCWTWYHYIHSLTHTNTNTHMVTQTHTHTHTHKHTHTHNIIDKRNYKQVIACLVYNRVIQWRYMTVLVTIYHHLKMLSLYNCWMVATTQARNSVYNFQTQFFLRVNFKSFLYTMLMKEFLPNLITPGCIAHYTPLTYVLLIFPKEQRVTC